MQQKSALHLWKALLDSLKQLATENIGDKVDKDHFVCLSKNALIKAISLQQ